MVAKPADEAEAAALKFKRCQIQFIMQIPHGAETVQVMKSRSPARREKATQSGYNVQFRKSQVLGTNSPANLEIRGDRDVAEESSANEKKTRDHPSIRGILH